MDTLVGKRCLGPQRQRAERTPRRFATEETFANAPAPKAFGGVRSRCMGLLWHDVVLANRGTRGTRLMVCFLSITTTSMAQAKKRCHVAATPKCTMITKLGWIIFCYPPVANEEDGFIAHEFEARMSISAIGILYVKSKTSAYTVPSREITTRTKPNEFANICSRTSFGSRFFRNIYCANHRSSPL